MKMDYLILNQFNEKIVNAMLLKNKKILFGILLIFTGVLLSAFTPTNDDIAQKIQLVDVEKQEKELQADLLLKKANDFLLRKDYEKACNLYLKTISLLSSMHLNNERINKKMDNVRESLSLSYMYWASMLLKQAQETAELGKIKNAIELCQKATEINPDIKSKANNLIKQLQQEKNSLDYKNFTSEKTFNTSHADKEYNADVLYEQGKVLLKENKLNEAKEKFENILVLNPYNSRAIEYLKEINNKIYNKGLARTNITFDQRLAEENWSKIPPTVSKTFSGERIDVTGVTPILKQSETVGLLKKKLDTIKIKHLDFEDVPAATALLYLKQESVKLDPEGKGINLFLILPEQKADTETGQQQSQNQSQVTDNNQTPPPKVEQYLVTIILDNVTLAQAIDYICKATGLKYKVENYAVKIVAPNIPFDEMETRVYPIEKDIFGTAVTETVPSYSNPSIDLKTFFIDRGINFPTGALALYDAKISRLIVKNTTSELAKLEALFSKLNVFVPEVSIQAKFVELKQKDFDELGFEWRLTPANASTNDAINRYATTQATAAEQQADRAFGFYIEQDDTRIDGVIHALDQNRRTQTISAPKVTTLSGHRATIRMVTETYYPTGWSDASTSTQSGSGSSANIAYKIPSTPIFGDPTDLGVIFSVTPYVCNDNYTIDLELEPQTQAFAGWSDYSYTDTGDSTSTFGLDFTILMPQIKARMVQTRVRIYDGETVVMGGGLTDATTTIHDKIPFLGDIPLIGRFFTSEYQDTEKVNLLIFTKVQLINPDGSLLRPPGNNGMPRFRD